MSETRAWKDCPTCKGTGRWVEYVGQDYLNPESGMYRPGPCATCAAHFAEVDAALAQVAALRIAGEAIAGKADAIYAPLHRAWRQAWSATGPAAADYTADVEMVGAPVLGEFTVVSLFSGCGGMDVGFLGGFATGGKIYDRLPFEIVWANDLNKAACETYKTNTGHDIHCGDIWKLMDTLPPKADIVIGGFPCQDVSVNGKLAGIGGKKTGLYKAMVEVVSRLKPKMFVAENVKGLYSDEKRPLLKIEGEFRALGYEVVSKLYLAADYGVPQMRERVFIVGTSKNDGIPAFVHPEPTLTKEQWITAKDAIGDLEDVPESKEASHTWSRAEVSAEQGNRKLKADRPSATIRAECHGNIQFHYGKTRRLSMREAARIQTFPDTFRFMSGLRETERMVGNAVPPVLAWHIARAVRERLL